MFRRLGVVIVAAIFAASCTSDTDETSESEANAMAEMSGPPPVTGDTVTTASGLQYIEIRSGTGQVAQAGQTVQVHYTGWLTDGTKFDSSVDRGSPFSFQVGAGRVIPGWDEGVALMRVGDKRRFILPPDLAYGDRGVGDDIPPGATLIFDVELLAIGG